MKLGRVILWSFIAILVGGSAAGMMLLTRSSTGEVNWKTYYETEKQSESDVPEKVVETETQVIANGPVLKPKVDEQLLTKNKYSRPGTKVDEINYVVIHYLGNPGTTAQENRDYFESLKDLKNASMSANYIVGLDGEVIQCVPDGEIAFASNSANKESISIENCNIDDTGKFIKDTYISLVKLTGYLSEQYHLDRDHIIRHHDVTGKDCPIYYVEHEDAWETFLDDVELYKQLCKEKSPDLEYLDLVLAGIQYTYDSKFDKDIVITHEEGKEQDKGRPHDAESVNEESSSDSSASSTEKTQEEPVYHETEGSSYENNSNNDSSGDSGDHYYDDSNEQYYEEPNEEYYDNSNEQYYEEPADSGNSQGDDSSAGQAEEPAPEAPAEEVIEEPADQGDIGIENGTIEVTGE